MGKGKEKLDDHVNCMGECREKKKGRLEGRSWGIGSGEQVRFEMRQDK